MPSELLRPHFVPIAEAAALLGCGRTKLYEYVNRGSLHAVHHGKRSVVSVAEIDKLARDLAVDAGVPPSALEVDALARGPVAAGDQA